GKSAPNPFLSTLEYFRDEYEAHIKEKRCPALACKELISFYIDPEKCTGCGMCKKQCPAEAIDGDKKIIHIIDQEKCTNCGTCFEVCPAKFSSITKLSGVAVPEPVAEDKRKIVKKSSKASKK
ncbi:MAG: 4Fe-4S dicluster domain-containing protein, partial [Desulfobacteraceae bacterium]|nr:4Fe-4S dicluster domain-containing protein [Desulfobacteraceae bacterium]